MRVRPRPFTIVLLFGALVGLLFASVSTYDFVMHLDRQVHDVHCSFVPGLTGTEQGVSGCQVTLVSPYSSVLRQEVWGGVPISLPAMSVFAFLLFFGLELLLSNRQEDTRATGFLALATALPALTSAIMGYLSLVELDAACKLCMGIYAASAISLTGGLGLWLSARSALRVPPDVEAEAGPEPVQEGAEPAWVGARGAAAAPREERQAASALRRPSRPAVSFGYLAGAFGIGVLFVVVPVIGYLVAAPEHERFVGACGGLATAEDEYGVMLDLDPHPGKPPAIEILDPLCPACRGFEQRLAAGGLDAELDRKAVLFPLDDTCNWMVDKALHPGACAVSEAMLCAGERATAVLDWAFEHQEEIRAAAASDPTAAQALVKKYFPDLARCVGSPEVKSRLNRSLRWAVSNRLPVLTPQLYVGGVKLCDEDVDLGLDFMLARMLDAFEAGTLQATGGTAAGLAEEPLDEPAAPGARPPAAGASGDTARDGSGHASPAAGQPSGGAAAPGGAPGAATPGQATPGQAEPGAEAPAEPAGGERGSQPAAGEEPAQAPGAQPGRQRPGAEPGAGGTDPPAEPAAPATGERGSAAGVDEPPAGSDPAGGETP